MRTTQSTTVHIHDTAFTGIPFDVHPHNTTKGGAYVHIAGVTFHAHSRIGLLSLADALEQAADALKHTDTSNARSKS